MYVCMYACMHACMHACTSTRLRLSAIRGFEAIEGGLGPQLVMVVHFAWIDFRFRVYGLGFMIRTLSTICHGGHHRGLRLKV